MANEIFVISSPPSSKQSVNAAIAWMNDVTKKVDNANDLWEALTPNIKKSVKNEFSESNPNKWDSITKAWRDRKIANNWPVTVGVRTGALRDATSDKANILYSNHYMQWDINGEVSGGAWGSTGDKVSEYAGYFHARREIFVATMEYINKTMQAAVRKFVESITSKA